MRFIRLIHVLVIAHRGDSAHYPENTMPAFEKALRAGADMIEMDVRLTKDGKVVVFHDEDLRRIFGLRERVGDISYERLCRLTREAVPLLSEVLDTFRSRLRFYVEVKAEGLSQQAMEFLVRQLWENIRMSRTEKDCLVASFDHRVPAQYRILVSRAWTGFIFDDATPFWVSRESDFLDVDVFCPHKRLLTRERVEWAKAMGKQVFPWVLDDPQEQERAMHWGVDGIVTNDPAKLRGGIRP